MGHSRCKADTLRGLGRIVDIIHFHTRGKPLYARVEAEWFGEAGRALFCDLPSWILKTPGFFVRLKPQQDRYGPNQHQADSSGNGHSTCALVRNSPWNCKQSQQHPRTDQLHTETAAWGSQVAQQAGTALDCSTQKHLFFPMGHLKEHKTLKRLPT